ncbi:polysaccharide pyruvyl transferase family protein [Maribacter arenosus]|uniref:Polysaccharide pyruvyl transferase family protein n=1 Tax=Maribacter arenosus TaxID=1854708 RepID=A0ABR7VCF9_9FLAO|nr:polysaccharide pyruvyl transferase family protein [Maribacter arenosus]MBD0850591.1 polysaccharide pyruvyl transferase family protein [Maribacter arenosus]
MKIALVTIHKVTNYGAVLQAYATKVALSKHGEVSIIDYQNRHLAQHMDLVRFELSVHGIKMLAHDLLNLPNRYKLLLRFRKFISSNMSLTNEFKSSELLEGKADNFDIYVCGSDQIWNPGVVSAIRKLDPIFFLSFVKSDSKKFSFASSIGHHQYSEDEKKEVRKLLKDFSMISVREKDGQIKLQEILPEKDVYHVVDPTLLLSKKEWYDSFNIKEEEPNENYILVYSVPRTTLIKKAIEFFAKKLDMKIVAIDRMLLPITKIDMHVRDAGPNEFIHLYANASFVITDSFHGTCFAVNFEKPFACISANEKANRQESLLELLGLRERIMYKENDFNTLPSLVDYVSVTRKLEIIRNASLQYIAAAVDK